MKVIIIFTTKLNPSWSHSLQFKMKEYVAHICVYKTAGKIMIHDELKKQNR